MKIKIVKTWRQYVNVVDVDDVDDDGREQAG